MKYRVNPAAFYPDTFDAIRYEVGNENEVIEFWGGGCSRVKVPPDDNNPSGDVIVKSKRWGYEIIRPGQWLWARGSDVRLLEPNLAAHLVPAEAPSKS